MTAPRPPDAFFGSTARPESVILSQPLFKISLFCFLCAFTLLVCNAAACLASRLAGSLALATTAVFSAVT